MPINGVGAYEVDTSEPLYEEGWNRVTGLKYSEGETITLKIHRGGSSYIELGSTKVDIDGKWVIYFKLEDLEYWPLGESRGKVWINVFSSLGPVVKFISPVSTGIDVNIFPPRDYFQPIVQSENKIIKDILWKLYVNPDVSSILYREVSVNKIVEDRRLIKNLHFRVRRIV